jgi:hypothetical protein
VGRMVGSLPHCPVRDSARNGTRVLRGGVRTCIGGMGG